jgi:hypothetical protein
MIGTGVAPQSAPAVFRKADCGRFGALISERTIPMAKGKTGGRQITVTGFVEEYEDDEGNYGLLLDASSEDYIIEIDKVGKQLRKLVGEEVEVTGIVIKDHDDFRHLRVEQFELLESDDDYEDRYDVDDDDRVDYESDDY